MAEKPGTEGKETNGALRSLIEACLLGEEGAWETLLGRYSGLIYSVALRYGLSEVEAADVFQNVCLSLWRSLEQLRDFSRLEAWLMTVSARLAWQQARERFHLHLGLALPEGEVPEAEAGAPEEVLLLKEEWRTLGEALGRLPQRCRRLVWHLFYDPSAPSYAEVAQRLGMPLGSIGPVRRRCLERLRALLEAAETPG